VLVVVHNIALADTGSGLLPPPTQYPGWLLAPLILVASAVKRLRDSRR
jgi:hypothetical protein